MDVGGENMCVSLKQWFTEEKVCKNIELCEKGKINRKIASLINKKRIFKSNMVKNDH